MILPLFGIGAALGAIAREFVDEEKPIEPLGNPAFPWRVIWANGSGWIVEENTPDCGDPADIIAYGYDPDELKQAIKEKEFADKSADPPADKEDKEYE